MKNIQGNGHVEASFFSPLPCGVLGISALTASPLASATCGCPDDGHGAPKAATGLGHEFPQAPDLVDAAWQVYEFERDGIRYVQVNDRSGVVRAAAGRIGETFWAMLIGSDADRVAVQGDAAPVGTPQVLFRSSDVEVGLYRDGSRQRWLIRAPVTH